VIRLHFFAPDTSDLSGRLVALATGSAYCHVALEVDDVVWEATREGHRRVPLAEYGRGSARQVLLAPDDGRPAADVEAQVVEALDARLGDGYGYLDGLSGGLGDLLGALLGRFYVGDARASNCSHYVAQALDHAGYPLPADPNTLTPGDLARTFAGEAPCRSLRERLRRAFPRQ
jgi:hypothetical protein